MWVCVIMVCVCVCVYPLAWGVWRTRVRVGCVRTCAMYVLYVGVCMRVICVLCTHACARECGVCGVRVCCVHMCELCVRVCMCARVQSREAGPDAGGRCRGLRV